MLSFKTKLAYGLGGIGDCASYSMIGTFAVFYLTTVVGVSPVAAGAIAAIGSMWQAVCGAFAGHISDHTRSKFGRRKPFIIASAVPLGIFIALFFNAVEASFPIQVLYYLIVMLLFWTAYTFFFVPYLALGSEITLDYSDRTALRGYSYFFNIIGMLIGVIAPNLVVDALVQFGKSVEGAWSGSSILVGISISASILIMAFLTKTGEMQLDTEADSKTSAEHKRQGVISGSKEIITGCIELFRFRPVRLLILTSIFYLLANTFFNAGRMYFFTYNLELSAVEISLVLMCMEISTAALVPTILWLNRRVDKRSLFLSGMGISVLSIIFLNMIGVNTFAYMCVFIVFYSIGGACYWQLVTSMMYDACEADKLMNRKDRSGLILSFQALSESLSNAIGLQMLGVILNYAGFNETATVQTQTALMACEISAIGLPAVFMILTLVMVARYPITKQVYQRILSALEGRSRGQEPDLTAFQHLM